MDGTVQHGRYQHVDVGLGRGDPGGEQRTQTVGVGLVAQQIDERVEVGDGQRLQQLPGAGRLTKSGQRLERLQRHQQLGLVTGVAVVADGRGYRNAQSFFTQVALDRLFGARMGLQ